MSCSQTKSRGKYVSVSEHVWVHGVGVAALSRLRLSACLCLTCGHLHVPKRGSVSQHLSISTECGGAHSCPRRPHSHPGTPKRPPTHLTGVKLQGLGTRRGIRPKKCSILKQRRLRSEAAGLSPREPSATWPLSHPLH